MHAPHANRRGGPQAVSKIGQGRLKGGVEAGRQRVDHSLELPLHLLSVDSLLFDAFFGDTTSGAQTGQLGLDAIDALLGLLQI